MNSCFAHSPPVSCGCDGVLQATTTPFALNFAEFVGALAEFCVLNGDGIRQLVWDHLAVYKDEDDHPAVDLTKVGTVCVQAVLFCAH